MEYVIIGDGVAGATAAETVREKDQSADIKIITDESEPLYNRIMLKTYMKGSLPKQYTRLHDENWYEKRNIDLHLNTRVENVDSEKKQLETSEGEKFSYDKLLIATGGSPRKLPEDQDFENVHYMWTMSDAEKIRDSAEESDEAVVIGGGLLGIDLAVAYANNDVETHYLIKDDNWWHRGLDQEGAEIIHGKLEELGINVVTNTEVKKLNTSDGKVDSVKTNNGRYNCESVAVAIGQVPNSDIVGVEKNSSEMIKTDKYLNTSDNDIYAAGNLIEYDSVVFNRDTVNGSWDHSEAMGETAALNMIGAKEEFDYVNTYGVGHFDVQFLAIGDWTGEPVSSSYEEEDHYRRLFFEDGKLVGAVLIGNTKGQNEIREKIKEGVEIEDKEKLF